MNEKLDVFEILGQKHTEDEYRDQERETVPDPDFNEAIKLLKENNSKPVKTVEKVKSVPVKKKSNKSRIVLDFMILIAVLLMVFTFIINVSDVSGNSMSPTLENGDKVIINRLARSFEPGDIIVFETDSGEKFVKRIIAVDGDVVSITADKKIYLNGREAEEDYVTTETEATDIRVSYPIIVDEDEYFVLGDNRISSKDSRDYDVGMVQKEEIVGKMILSIRKY